MSLSVSRSGLWFESVAGELGKEWLEILERVFQGAGKDGSERIRHSPWGKETRRHDGNDTSMADAQIDLSFDHRRSLTPCLGGELRTRDLPKLAMKGEGTLPFCSHRSEDRRKRSRRGFCETSRFCGGVSFPMDPQSTA